MQFVWGKHTKGTQDGQPRLLCFESCLATYQHHDLGRVASSNSVYNICIRASSWTKEHHLGSVGKMLADQKGEPKLAPTEPMLGAVASAHDLSATRVQIGSPGPWPDDVMKSVSLRSISQCSKKTHLKMEGGVQ